MLFKDGKEIDKVTGENVVRLTQLIEKLKRAVEDAKAKNASGSTSSWKGAALPRGYVDVTDQVELNRSELLNVDTETGGVRVLFSTEKPSALSGGKATPKDWVESDTDDQLLLFMPFQSMLKLHTLQVGSAKLLGYMMDYATDIIFTRSPLFLLLTTTTTTRRP